MHSIYQLITDTGDLMVTLPLALGLIAMLWLSGARRSALAMAGGLAVCFGALGLLKLMFVACGDYWHAGLHSPSGHTGMSTYVYGSYALVLLGLIGNWRGPLIALGLGLLVGAIGASRLLLHCHTPVEVLVGLLVGSNALLVFAHFHEMPAERARMRPAWLFAALVVAMLGLHGNHAQAEGLLYRFALAMRTDYGICMEPTHPLGGI